MILSRPLAAALLAALLAPALAAQTDGAGRASTGEPELDPGEVAAPDGAALFAAHCARCHGAVGAGDGPDNAQLERPARSFAEGGFAFGDTVEAIRRTLEMGIPGSPMPAFGDAFTEAERHAVAEHVRALIPERRRITPDDTELVVRDAAVMARGHLAPLTASARPHARGLVLGTPDGLGFVLRADDVRLLGVTQGRLLRRSDWTGRGGTALELLGRMVWLASGGDPGPRWFEARDGEEHPLRLALERTELRGARASVAARLLDARGAPRGRVELTLGGVDGAPGPGFERDWRVQAEPGALLVLRASPPDGARDVKARTRRAGLAGPCHGPELHLVARSQRAPDGALALRRWLPANHVVLDADEQALLGTLRFRFGARGADPSCPLPGPQRLREQWVLLPRGSAVDGPAATAFLDPPDLDALVEQTAR